MGVEAGEPERRADGMGKREDPAVSRNFLERPKIEDYRGRHAERDNVGEGIELRAEAALTVHHSGNATVHAVEHRRDDAEDTRPFPIPGDGERDAGGRGAKGG